MLDSGAVRILHGGAVGIPEAKAAKVFGSLRGLRVEIGIGVDSLVTLGSDDPQWSRSFGRISPGIGSVYLGFRFEGP